MIRVLPANIANLIAAGEVIQRPSSVVKELMENAVDAGASQITLVVNDSGRTLVQVIDNGCGMDEDEAVLCFERHATSKIEKAEDIYGITTYGFRGEALASIASCADVTLKTRKAGKQTGIEIHIAENEIKSKESISAPQGSNFAVRNIFYARLKLRCKEHILQPAGKKEIPQIRQCGIQADSCRVYEDCHSKARPGIQIHTQLQADIPPGCGPQRKAEAAAD